MTLQKIAIPSMGKKGLQEIVAEHFGRCPTYTILDEKGTLLEILHNSSSHMGGQGLPPELLKKNTVNVLLCQGIGPKALQLCQDLKIEVYVDYSSTVKELFDKWKNQKLSKADSNDSCKEHLS